MKQDTDMEAFKIKSYSKKELALMYFPDSVPETAVKHLMALIRRNDMLWDELQKMGYYSLSRTFSPRQVQAIVDWLGAP